MYRAAATERAPLVATTAPSANAVGSGTTARKAVLHLHLLVEPESRSEPQAVQHGAMTKEVVIDRPLEGPVMMHALAVVREMIVVVRGDLGKRRVRRNGPMSQSFPTMLNQQIWTWRSGGIFAV